MKALKPIKLVIISILIWGFFYIQVPVEYLYSGNLFFPILTLLLFVVAFVVGVLSLKTASVKPIRLASDRKLKQIIIVFFIVGAFGVLLKIYVGIFNSGIFLANDVFEQRLENMGKELTGGFIGIIASILFPFSFVSLLIAIYNYKILEKSTLAVITLFGVYPFIETVFMGGRTIIALLGTVLLFVIFASYNKNSNIPNTKVKYGSISLLNIPKFIFKKTVYIPLIIFLLLFVSYSINVVNQRLLRFGYGDQTFRIWEQRDYQWVKFDDDFKEVYFQSSQEDKARMIGIYSLKHYFAHGVVEYIRLVNHLDKTTGYYYGQYEFSVFFKFFRAFGVPLKSNEEMQSIMERKAVYKTFFGPFYVDFGVLGIFIMFFWGRFIKRVFVYAQKGHTQYVIFYAYLATIIITSAFLNFLLGSSSYYLFAFFIGLLVFRLWPNNLVFVLKK